MRWLSTSLLGLFLLAAGPVAPGEQDIFKRPIPTEQARPTVVVYANHQTQDAVTDPLADFAVQVNDIHPLILVRIDLRGLPGFLQGFAFENMRSRFVNGLKRYWTETQKHGGVPHPQPENSLFFIEDREGLAHQAAGLGEGFQEALAIIYDAHGQEIARGAFPREAGRLEEALRGAVGPP